MCQANRGTDDKRRHAWLINLSRPGGRDEGIAFVTVAISLLVLLGMAALAIDGSNLYRERGDAQNAADLAAYAAAYDACTGGSDPLETARAQARANGFDDDDPGVNVHVAEEPDGWRVEVSAEADRYFSRILGADIVNIAAEAVVRCIRGGQMPTLYTSGICQGRPALTMFGESNTVHGDVHSNFDIQWGGGQNVVTGRATYVTEAKVNGHGHDFGEGPDQVDWRPWPMILRPEDFEPGGIVEQRVGSSNYHYADEWHLTRDDIRRGGVYVAREKIALNASYTTARLTLVTLPTRDGAGTIDITGAKLRLEPYYKNILAFSEHHKGGSGYPYIRDYAPPRCGSAAIKIATADTTWEGLLYAARGMVSITGARDVDFGGSILAHDIKIAGSRLQFSSLGGDDGPTQLVLVE